MNSILFILLSLLGFQVNMPKHSLHKQPTCEDLRMKISFWIEMNSDIIALAIIAIGLLIFTIFCFWIVGVSATDSGLLYNNFDKVI